MFFTNPVLKLRRVFIAALPVASESCGSLTICSREWHPIHLIVYGCSEFLMEAVPYLPIEVLRFCSNRDYGCSVWNVQVRLVSLGCAYFYFERLSFPRHLSWNAISCAFPLTLSQHDRSTRPCCSWSSRSSGTLDLCWYHSRHWSSSCLWCVSYPYLISSIPLFCWSWVFVLPFH